MFQAYPSLRKGCVIFRKSTKPVLVVQAMLRTRLGVGWRPLYSHIIRQDTRHLSVQVDEAE